MPELRFSIIWPDGAEEICYSPSTVIRGYYSPGVAYTLAEFVARSREALTAASERVRAQYGHACSLALGQLARIEATAAGYPETTEVLFVSFEE